MPCSPLVAAPPRRALLLLALAVGCAEDPKTSSGELTLSPDVLDFGEVAVGEELSLRATITNESGDLVEVLSASLIEGSPGAWLVERDGGPDIEDGQTLDVVVTFTPSATGEEIGRVQVRTGSELAPSWFIAVSGTGTASVQDLDGDGFSSADGDCDDTNPALYPGAVEACDGIDTNCDGIVPIEEADGDYDGVRVCAGDCDDYDARVYPGAEEICDGKDSDCDGVIGEELDQDGDLYTICDGDCDDLEPNVHPDLVEVCDLLDNDCSGLVDDIDGDADGHSPCAGGGDCDDNDPLAFPVVVDPASTAGVPDGTIEAPFRTLEEALPNLDAICRTVVLAPATYVVNVDWTDRSLQINGAGVRPGQTVLTTDAGAPSRMFRVSNGASLTLVNVALVGGQASGDGGAVYALNGNVVLDGVVADGNSCTGDGAAVAVQSGSLRVRGSTFTNNSSADDGGALSVLAGAFEDSGSQYVSNEGVRGGALLLESSTVSLVGSTFQDNRAATKGGALAMVAGGGVMIEGNSFFSNFSGGTGGALDLSDVYDPDGVVRNNHVADNQAAGSGGGLYLGGSNAGLVVVNNTFHANAGGARGAGVSLEATAADELWFWSNLVTWSDGPYGLWVRDGSNASVGYNSAYATAAGEAYDFELFYAEDAGFNRSENPVFLGYTPDGDPTNDDLGLNAVSPVRDAGPTDGAGPSTYTTWSDPDGSVNDRGMTGGPGTLP